MGQSIVLLEKKPLELSIEIDKDITLEISTGFQSGINSRSYVTIGMPVSLEDLDNIIVGLSNIKEELKDAWKCKHCGALNPESLVSCNNCDMINH